MELQKVVIVGAGTMGRGIASWFATRGVMAQVTDKNEAALDDARKQVFSSWDKLQERKKFSAEQVIGFKKHFETCEERDIDFNADLVIEAIIEDLDIKRSLFDMLDNSFSGHTILASNTSSLSMGELTRDLKEARKKRFVGLHFFNPAPVMKLVEIIPGPETEKSLAEDLYRWFDREGKKPALCRDVPGFIVNRVARNFYGEALRMVDPEREESFKHIDQVMRDVGGFKMGPFELMDLIGVDVNYHVSQSVWTDTYFEPRFAPHELQKKMLESGRLGRKTKRGFYHYG